MSTSFLLQIDPDLCCQCGDCEMALPGLLEKAKSGRLRVSGRSLGIHAREIMQALESCSSDALFLTKASEGDCR